MLVYLAGPIDLVDQDTSHSWRTKAAAKLVARGCGVFSPAHAFQLPFEPPPDRDMALSVLDINKAALNICDALLGNLEGTTIGTPIEIQDFVTFAPRPMACFGGNEQSLYVKTWPNYESMDEAIDALFDPDWPTVRLPTL